MPKYDLDKTWELCLEMWAWIKEQIEAGSGFFVGQLKNQWLEDNGFEDIYNNCFFCEYALADEEEEVDCGSCPGRLIDFRFSCHNADYHYRNKPLALCQKLLELETTRISNKKG